LISFLVEGAVVINRKILNDNIESTPQALIYPGNDISPVHREGDYP
jgi:hypothetical protein